MTRCPKAKTQGNTRFQEPKFEAAICFHNRSFEPEVGGPGPEMQIAEWSRVCGRKGSSDQVTRLPKFYSFRAYLPRQAAGRIRAEGWSLGKMRFLVFKVSG